MKTIAVVISLLSLTSNAMASNFLLKVVNCVMPAVYPTADACKQAGDSLPQSPPYECVPHSGNLPPPPIVALICPKK